MADREKQESARRATQGDVDETARHLRQRVRSGELKAELLRAAATVGDPAARLAAESPDVPLAEALEAACRLLSRTEMILFACDCAERVVSVWEDHDDYSLVRDAIAAARESAAGGEITPEELEFEEATIAEASALVAAEAPRASAAAAAACEAVGSCLPDSTAPARAASAARCAAEPAEDSPAEVRWQVDRLCSALLRGRA